MDLHVT